MVELYVLFDTDGILYRVSNIQGTGQKVILANGVIDFTKLVGYEISETDYLVFNENKYNAYMKVLQEQQEYEQAIKEFNKYAQENILPKLDDTIANSFAPLYPDYQIGVSYKVDDKFNYNSKLYKVLQAHISQVDWKPDEVPALYKEV